MDPSRESPRRRAAGVESPAVEYRNPRRSGLRPSADELGLSLAQHPLSWCLRQPEVSSVIVGVTCPAQLDDDVEASGTRLPDDRLDRIDEILPAPAN